MPTLVASITNPNITAGEATFTVVVKLKADLPDDPPRATFSLRLPLETNASALKAAVEEGVRQAYKTYLEGQAANTRIAAVTTFLTGKTYSVEV